MCGWRKMRRLKHRKSRRPRKGPAPKAPTGAGFPGVRAPLFDLVVWCFPRNDHVVHVAFAQSGDCDSNEAGTLLQFGKRRYAAVAHSALESSDELVHQR